MKKTLLALVSVIAAGFTAVQAETPTLNLTPKPKSVKVEAEGSFTLPQALTIGTAGLDEDWTAEATRFGAALSHATGITATTGTDNAQLTIVKDENLAAEGYTLTVGENGIEVKASTPAGLYFGLQTIKKILPANVMAGVKKEGTYSLPYLTIEDEPRYDYRGFMLDCARHFYTVEEVKRMIEVMSYYKLNYFHWHLTDDQGWRLEMPNYPRLQTIAATAPNSIFTDMYSKTQYWINKPYGPYFYTQEQMRDVVAYAKERHIEVIPEVEMPDHLCAAMAAYPEFSCWPDGDHRVWDTGGISSDVLNVANPAAVQFAKDIIDTLIDIFPADFIHIGGDECPATGWEQNEECKAAYKANGYKNIREHQSRFCKEMADYARTKGRSVAFWNEAVTYDGMNLDEIKSTEATIYCWTGPDDAAEKSQKLGLRCIYTPWGPYYINRKQAPNDPPGAGYGNDDVKATYERQPFQSLANKDNDLCFGVQGTFWCEHVSDREYMEWLALPRLIAIAEIGWTPQNKRNFDDFIARVSADRDLLDYNGYKYTEHHMLPREGGDEPVEPGNVMPDPEKWYRLITKASDARKGLCVELDLSQADIQLWGRAQAENNDNQWWKFVEDPANKGHYAMVCKHSPEGSVNTTPTGEGNNAMWTYSVSEKHYDFILDNSHYGAETDGTYHYALHSTKAADDMYMNQALSGKNFRINMHNNPEDGNSGLFVFYPEGGPTTPVDPAEPVLTAGGTYVIENLTFEGYSMADNADTQLGAANAPWQNNVWNVAIATTNPDGSQTITLENAVTGRYVAAAGSHVNRLGKPVSMGDATADITVSRNADGTSAAINVSGNGLWPLPADATSAPLTVRAGRSNEDGTDVYAPQGNAWKFTPVAVKTFDCTDKEGNSLGSFTGGVADGTELSAAAPQLKNMTLESATEGTDGHVACVYTRSAYTVRYEGATADGIIVMTAEENVAPGTTYTLKAPEVPYLHFERFGTDATTITVNSDCTVPVIYSTEGVIGVDRPTRQVTEVEAGKYYLIRDAHADRNAWRGELLDGTVKGVKTANNLSPFYIWQLEAGTNGKFNVKNYASGKYIQALVRSQAAKTGTKPYGFTFAYDTDHWTITGGNGLSWDGNDDMSLVGWTSPGHPIEIYEFVGKPYFTVTVVSVDSEGKQLASVERYVAPGADFVVGAPFRKGYTITAIDGTEGLDKVEGNKTVTITYTSDKQSSISEINAAGNASSAIYDLRGNRLSRISAPGIYIVNGVKVLVK